MKVYKCKFTNDEIFSDMDKDMEQTLEHGIVYTLPGKYIVKGQEDFGIANNDEDGGELEEGAVQVIDIVDANRLVETQFNKKGYQQYIKVYMKRVVETIDDEDEKKVFMAGAKVFLAEMLGRFDDLQFFVGESEQFDGHIALATWAEDGSSCKFYFFKHGLKGEKV